MESMECRDVERFNNELRKWQSLEDLEDFSEDIRTQLAEVPGPCVLDLSEENILSFGQGDWSLVERDIRAAFSSDLADLILNCFKDVVQTCLAVRRELINYKKLCLHMWQAGAAVEKDLRQLASFFYCELVNGKAPDARRQRYVEIANAFNECRGAVAAIFDARHFSKAICALPRHVKTGMPWKFEALPQSLELWKPLEQAQHFLENYQQMDVFFASIHQDETPTKPETPEGEEEVMVTKPSKPKLCTRQWKSERKFVQSDLGSEGLRSMLCSIEATGLRLPPRALLYVELVLIARGASKACDWAKRLEERFKELLEPSSTSLSSTAISAGLHLHGTRHLLMIKGMLPVLEEMLRWLEPISEMRADDARLFVSGSRGAAAFVPRGFPDLLARHRSAICLGGHREAMLAELAPGGSGWPRSARPANEGHCQQCRMCLVQLSRLWLHRSLCLLCEANVRSEGRCPYGGDRCGSRSFCPHEKRCIVCEQWSCEQCQLLRGDGEDVWQLVVQRQPSLVFLDFDRTLCTTKAGASPLQGMHSLDADLVTVCRTHSSVLIVTRSSRSEDIVVFLKRHGIHAGTGPDGPDKSSAKGLQGNVWVRSVKREGLDSKAAVILEAMDKEKTGLFVDDDIKELTDAALRELVAQRQLLRLLFVRSGGKE
ncbi:unnamed protein product [Cladocopium goreaui]|uniref:Retrovirus-related Pol polyprotein from transposon TNT 1-94 n=1 Tax=Cladocopium goreaui TaxID=2562237 RepID=A0A9P1FUJ1_9DINO|nr:unnamed protein product [Cladocopium goreaui]